MANAPTDLGSGHNSITSTTLQLTLTDNVNAGDLLIALCGNNANAAPAFSDSQTGTWTIINVGTAMVWNAAADRMTFGYSVAATSLASGVDWIKASTGGNSLKAMQLWRLTGYSAAPLDKTATSVSQSGTTINTGTTAATTQADEIAIAAYGYTSNPSFTPSAGWSQTTTTQVSTNANEISISLAYKLLAATGTQTGNGATLGTSQTSAAEIATFKFNTLPLHQLVTAPLFVAEYDQVSYGTRYMSGGGAAQIISPGGHDFPLIIFRELFN